MSENSKLKVQVIDLNNSAEIIKKKDQLLEVFNLFNRSCVTLFL